MTEAARQGQRCWAARADDAPRDMQLLAAALAIDGTLDHADQTMFAELPLRRLLGETYLPLGTTAHKQGRVAGETALGGRKSSPAASAPRSSRSSNTPPPGPACATTRPRAAGFDPVTIGSEADDHKAYYPGSHRIAMRFTGDKPTGRLLGVQLFGHRHAEVAKRIDIAATAIFHGMTIEAISDLDLS